jgi:hypothetical protein
MHALYSVLSRFSERETVAIRIGLAPRARDWGHAGLVLPRPWLGTPEGKAALNMPAGYVSGRAKHRWTSEIFPQLGPRKEPEIPWNPS